STCAGKNPKTHPLSPHPAKDPFSQGHVWPEGKTMPNTVLVGRIYLRVNEVEIWSFFKLYNTVYCEVKVITVRTGVSKGFGFVSFLGNVDVQKIIETQINFHDKKLKFGPVIRKQQNLNSSPSGFPFLLYSRMQRFSHQNFFSFLPFWFCSITCSDISCSNTNLTFSGFCILLTVLAPY
uniref:RRM domain-containing protein n=1 Tax=Junco hyemalis TaxID=40217 RepID=A0A8C5J1Z3_JUNHY